MADDIQRFMRLCNEGRWSEARPLLEVLKIKHPTYARELQREWDKLQQPEQVSADVIRLIIYVSVMALAAGLWLYGFNSDSYRFQAAVLVWLPVWTIAWTTVCFWIDSAALEITLMGSALFALLAIWSWGIAVAIDRLVYFGDAYDYVKFVLAVALVTAPIGRIIGFMFLGTEGYDHKKFRWEIGGYIFFLIIYTTYVERIW